MKFIIKNQKFIPEKQAQISINERGFLYGDGIFESLKIYNYKIYDFKNHLQRIKRALEIMRFDADLSDIEKKSLQLIKKNNIKNGILRISISRGIGGAGYLPAKNLKASTIIQTLNSRKLPKNISLGIGKIVAPKIAFKSMNSIPYILNKIDATAQGFFDLIMPNEDQTIAETSSANIFWVKKNKIYTSDESCNIVHGCVRKKILENKNLNIIQVREKISSLEKADEIFLTNSSFLVLPVDYFSGRKLQKTMGEKIFNLMWQDLKNSCK